MWILFFLIGYEALAADLKPKTLEEFQAYMEVADKNMEARANSSQRLAVPPSGAPVVELWTKSGTRGLTDALVHDWIGAFYVKGARLDDGIQVLQDISKYKDVYRPDILSAKLLQRDGDRLRVFMRVIRKKVITVVLDTEYDVDYRRFSPKVNEVWSRSVRISEVDDPGKPTERVKPPDTGWGFLWRLNSYWLLEERNGGLYMELRAISLTRGIPGALAWMIKPMVTSLPKESVTATLENTRRAVAARVSR